MLSFVVLVANPKPQSRTLSIARLAAEAVSRAAALPGEPQVIDLSGLARRLLLDEPSPAVEDALEQVRQADLLLVASPTYKGTYTGLLKVFLDRLDYQALSSVVALPMLVLRLPQPRARGRSAPAAAAAGAGRLHPRAGPGLPRTGPGRARPGAGPLGGPGGRRAGPVRGAGRAGPDRGRGMSGRWPQRQLHFNAFLMSSGHHEAAWRLPESNPFANTDLGHWRDLAQIAERAGFDSLFLADGPAVRANPEYRPASRAGTDRPAHRAGRGDQPHRAHRHRVNHLQRALQPGPAVRVTGSPQWRARRLEHRDHGRHRVRAELRPG